MWVVWTSEQKILPVCKLEKNHHWPKFLWQIIESDCLLRSIQEHKKYSGTKKNTLSYKLPRLWGKSSFFNTSSAFLFHLFSRKMTSLKSFAYGLSCFSCVWLCKTLWTITSQAPLSMGFSRQEYWSGLPCPPPGYLSSPGMELNSYISCIDRWVLYHLCHLGSPPNH